jgi:hypothetical protein
MQRSLICSENQVMDARTENAHLPVTCYTEAPAKPRRRRPHKSQKARPFAIEQLDKRTAAYAMFENLFAAVQSDCGGPDQISAVSRELILMFCSLAVYANDLSARGLAGQVIELGDLSLAASTLTRLASRIGLRRIPKPTMGLADYLESIKNDDVAESTE